METIIVSTTAKDYFTDTDLYQSLLLHDCHANKDSGHRLDFLDIKDQNKEGLTKVYNNFLDKYQDKDTIILSGQKGSSLDPSRSDDGLTSKIGMDASLPPGIDKSPYESVL